MFDTVKQTLKLFAKDYIDGTVTLSILTYSRMTPSIKDLIATQSKDCCYAECRISIVMLSVIILMLWRQIEPLKVL
jgi:hypothetical protein